MALLLEWYPDVDIAQHSFPLITIHGAYFKRTQREIICKSQRIPGEKIRAAEEFARTGEVVKEYVCLSI